MSFLLPLKPFLTALVMPLTSLLLLLMLCVLWTRRKATPTPLLRSLLSLSATACVALWVLSCQYVAVWLSQHLLPQVQTATPAELQNHQVQAIVVLGGGAMRDVPEYQGHVLSNESMARLLYALHLQRQSRLPLAFTGGVGWSDTGKHESEADVAALSLARLGLPEVRWLEGASKDTQQNAQFTRALLQKEGITRIALVTHAWHMPRAMREFEAAGFEQVVAAPMGFIRIEQPSFLHALPSPSGLGNSQLVLREWLGLQVARWRGA